MSVNNEFLNYAGLGRVVENIMEYVGEPLRSLAVKDKTICFYVDPNPTEDTVADFTVDIPVEYFLDQAKTKIVHQFAWTEEAYPGSTDPSLEGKPVLVFALKGDDGSVSYSFLNMVSMVDDYDGKENNSTKTIVDNATNEIEVQLKISDEEGNLLKETENGLMVKAPEAVDISGKADKLVDPEDGEAVVKADQILVDDGNGNLKGSGKTIAELTEEITGSFTAITNEQIDALFGKTNNG